MYFDYSRDSREASSRTHKGVSPNPWIHIYLSIYPFYPEEVVIHDLCVHVDPAVCLV